ncbi:DedA family protein [Pengzhenrongella sicca]|uniref:VTT domain-containing protein n=1 Tax=Pengzhenrongella sicca TaxID=2819238 RepID=A0A8A4Z9Q7_9MICO|nr:VTT domain-containing protein [Pengzhenrongella sicca]QTE28584.1 VTT domain-containing protein [Pengzhenrongella sicca]
MIDWMFALGGSPLTVLGLYLLVTLDGILPVVPSESVVIALAALAVSGGGSSLAVVLLVAAAGAFTGDQLAYVIGRGVGLRSIPLLRGRRGRAALDWAADTLIQRGPSFLLAARFIPGGRVVASVAAGGLHYPRRRFVAVTSVSAVTWSLYVAALGIGAGTWFAGQPVLAIGVGIAGGALVGLLVDRLFRRQRNRAKTVSTASRATMGATAGRTPEGPGRS